jgi:hypothetical protein
MAIRLARYSARIKQSQNGFGRTPIVETEGFHFRAKLPSTIPSSRLPARLAIEVVGGQHAAAAAVRPMLQAAHTATIRFSTCLDFGIMTFSEISRV